MTHIPVRPTSTLDRSATYRRIDRQNLGSFLRTFPDQCARAAADAAAFRLPSIGPFRSVVIAGMGGSGIGADYLRTMLPAHLRMPVTTVHGYDLPPGVDRRTLVVLVSHSGNTEETVSCYRAARAVRARMLVLTGGGTLARLARRDRTPLFRYAFTAPPRMSLGYLFVPLVVFLTRLRVLAPAAGNLPTAIAVIRRLGSRLDPDVPTARNLAKQLARRLAGTVPVVYGSDILAEVARRWKCQFNENAKTTSIADVLPELNHNTVEGIHHPAALRRRFTYLLLRSSYEHPQNAKRFRILEGVLRRARLPLVRMRAAGVDSLTQKLWMTSFGDFVSYYLAMLQGVDPTPVETIEGAKRQLARR
ncbi:MAG: bifunctional phosphoglucose/phosphomannose isomerase [Candidatus Kerfeldbacteria bacterium]|nr:bifunctional phosphoglucose/phosphomannose isomerase [Candidatus Kerfeldbacteria bacterium]